MATEVIEMAWVAPGAPYMNPAFNFWQIMERLREGLERDPKVAVTTYKAPLHDFNITPEWLRPYAQWTVDVEADATQGRARRIYPPVDVNDPKDLAAAEILFSEHSPGLIPVPRQALLDNPPAEPLPPLIPGWAPDPYDQYEHAAVVLWLNPDRRQPQEPVGSPSPSGDQIPANPQQEKDLIPA